MPSGTSPLPRKKSQATIPVHIQRHDRCTRTGIFHEVRCALELAIASTHLFPQILHSRAILGLTSICAPVVWALVAGTVFYVRSTAATPITQTLVRSSSSITFGIDAPNPSLQMHGSFREFRGSLDLNTQDIAQSQVQVSLTLSSAQLPPDQLLQALLLQTAISRIPNSSSTFRSSRIEHLEGMTYLLHGNYSWMKKERSASVPIEIARSSPALTEIRVFLSGALREGKLPQDLASMAGQSQGARGWSKATLIFARAKE